MPSKPRRAPKVPRIPKATHVDVTREEFNRVIDILNRRSAIIEEHSGMLVNLDHQQDVQFRRIADIQAELDLLKRLIQKLVAV